MIPTKHGDILAAGGFFRNEDEFDMVDEAEPWMANPNKLPT